MHTRHEVNEKWLIDFLSKGNIPTRGGVDLLTRWIGFDEGKDGIKRKIVRAGSTIKVTIAIYGTGPRSLGNVPYSFFLGATPEIIRIGRRWTKSFKVPCRPHIVREVEFVHLEIKLKPGSVFVERDVCYYVCASKSLRQRAQKKVQEAKNAYNL